MWTPPAQRGKASVSLQHTLVSIQLTSASAEIQFSHAPPTRDARPPAYLRLFKKSSTLLTTGYSNSFSICQLFFFLSRSKSPLLRFNLPNSEVFGFKLYSIEIIVCFFGFRWLWNRRRRWGSPWGSSRPWRRKGPGMKLWPKVSREMLRGLIPGSGWCIWQMRATWRGCASFWIREWMSISGILIIGRLSMWPRVRASAMWLSFCWRMGLKLTSKIAGEAQ